MQSGPIRWGRVNAPDLVSARQAVTRRHSARIADWQEIRTMENTLFILGAADVEMATIESLLRANGLRYVYAVGPNGERCHPGNAYKAIGYETTERTFHDAWNGDVVWIECGGDHPKADGFNHTFIDHHHPGDPGYGLPPEKFFEASSIGQLIMLIRGHDAYEDGRTWRQGPSSSFPQEDEGWDDTDYKDVAPELLMVAAADHCLGAAYRGQCPGVDPDALMRWRAESRAAFQKRPMVEVLVDIEAARIKLRDAIADQVARSGYGQPSEYIGNGQIRWNNGSGYMETSDCDFMGIIADLRPCNHCGGHGGALGYEDDTGPCHQGPYGQIPELPEASAREGIPFLASMTDRDGRQKVSIMGAGESLVKKFLSGELVPGLVDMYGDPARGFAGGYLPIKKECPSDPCGSCEYCNYGQS